MTTTSTGVAVLPYATEHFERVVEIFLEVFRAPPWNESWTADEARQQLNWLIGDERFQGWLLVEHDVAGFALGWIEHGLWGREFSLFEMGITGAYQRRGMGTFFLRTLEGELRRDHVTRAHVVTTADRAPLRFYEVNGYRLCAETKKSICLSKDIAIR